MGQVLIRSGSCARMAANTTRRFSSVLLETLRQ